ncbi:MAG: GNAT family N-acetyltransferase [Desulfobacterales bacterium]|nr:GNAT family N-acetyltransferase [Desulfobacterales bacterium]
MIDYLNIKPANANQIHSFIAKVFNQFVAPNYSKGGIEEFMKYIQPNELVKHLETNHFGVKALCGSKIVGVIILRDNKHIALFFVDSQHQKKGIGKELFRNALSQCRHNDADVSRITVNASPNSVDAYKKLNFELTDKEQCVNGIRFVPMSICPQSSFGD